MPLAASSPLNSTPIPPRQTVASMNGDVYEKLARYGHALTLTAEIGRRR
jgi:hypothetical protein